MTAKHSLRMPFIIYALTVANHFAYGGANILVWGRVVLARAVAVHRYRD